ncbi:MAG: OmpH family outer membrane protein [Phenylobacterium sp.]|uniref:OmpH family outer membrane protein n=1 Tax=Phenylobacterium sp. TaxID=1871053 RepID=UPI002732A737|nr:OmpH family outer membrane protein [Phenylobacterium sp.]MDP3172900.1 OmpH family outer membrane protein [Phenylobacterium sp.]
MNFSTFAVSACAVTLSLTTASVALAQAATPARPAAAPAAPAVTHGPALANVCVVSIEAAIGGSTVGKYVDTRMQQIVAQVNAELGAEKTAIDNEAKTLDGQRTTLDQSALEKRASDLQVRANALQRKAQQRDREVSATEQKAIARVGQELEPLIRQIYQQRQCSLLLQRSAVVIANPAMDVTPQVVAALNAKITQFAFDRERLDQAQPAAAGAR